MRRREAWAERLKTRWLELLLLAGFVGLVVWFGFALSPVLRPLLPTPPATATGEPWPTASSTTGPTPASRANASAGKFDGQRAFQHVLAQMTIGPRPAGSAAGRKTGDYIIAQLREHGWQVEEQEFVYRGVPGRNIIGKAGKDRWR